MIKGEGIMAFHGSAVFDPPNPKFREVLQGDFIHKNFGSDGYWYVNGASYDDRFIVDIKEDSDIADMIDGLRERVLAINSIVFTDENSEEVKDAAVQLTLYVYDMMKKNNLVPEVVH